MIIYLIILFYLSLILYQIYISLSFKEPYKCLNEFDRPYNELCIKKEGSETENICLKDRLKDLCNLDTKLEEVVKNNKPSGPTD